MVCVSADSGVICGQAAGPWHVSSCMLSWIMFLRDVRAVRASLLTGAYIISEQPSLLLFFFLALFCSHPIIPSDSLLTCALSFPLYIFFIIIPQGKLLSGRKRNEAYTDKLITDFFFFSITDGLLIG